MKDFLQNKYIKILFIIEFLLVFAGFIYVFMPTNEYNFEYNDLVYVDEATASLDGVTIDSDADSGYFIYGPSFNIKKGSYKVTVNYKTNGFGNYISVSGTDIDYNSVLMDDFTLNPFFEEQEFTVWALKGVNKFAVSVIYDGTESLTVSDIKVKELISGRVYIWLKLIAGLMLLNILAFAIMSIRNGNIKKPGIGYMLVLLFMGIVASYPLFTTFLTEGDDIVYHLLRIEGIKDGLLSGQFPVRIHPKQFGGYGYANSIFYGELFLYIPAILRLCGMPLQTAYKCFVFMVNAATAFVTFRCMESVFKDRKIALFCTFLYVFAPYRLTNIYVRAAVGEFSAMIFFPVIVCGLYHLFADDINDKQYQNIWLILTIGYTGLIQTHLLSCEMAAVFSVVICLCLFKRTLRGKTILQLVKFFASTVLVNAFFLVPLITYMIKGGVSVIDDGSLQTNVIQQNGIYIAQLFNLFVNGSGMAYGHAVAAYKELGMYQEMGTTVGTALILSVVLFTYILILHYNAVKKEKFFGFTAITAAFGCLFLYMSTSSFPWDFLCRMFGSVIYNLQFPWRMLALATVFLMAAAGGTILIARSFLKDNIYKICLGVIISACTVTAMYQMYDNLNNSKAVYTYDATAFIGSGSGSLDEYMLTVTETDDFTYVPTASLNVSIDSYLKEYTNITMNVTENSETVGLVTVPLINYLGYRALDNRGEELKIYSDNNGILTVVIPSGYSGSVTISYVGLWFWHAADIISLIAIAFLVCLGIKYCKKQSDI